MIISEKNRLKKNQYILTAVTTSLAFGYVSDASSSNKGYASPLTAFVSAENCNYPVGYKLEDGFMEAGPGSSG